MIKNLTTYMVLKAQLALEAEKALAAMRLEDNLERYVGLCIVEDEVCTNEFMYIERCFEDDGVAEEIIRWNRELLCNILDAKKAVGKKEMDKWIFNVEQLKSEMAKTF